MFLQYVLIKYLKDEIIKDHINLIYVLIKKIFNNMNVIKIYKIFNLIMYMNIIYKMIV